MTRHNARIRLARWAERLQYLEKELARLPGAIQTAKERVAYWQTRVVEDDEDTVAEAVIPEPVVMQTAQLTRTDDRYLGNYSPRWRR